MPILTGNDIASALSSFAESQGYAIDQALTTSQKGIDIEDTKLGVTRCFANRGSNLRLLDNSAVDCSI